MGNIANFKPKVTELEGFESVLQELPSLKAHEKTPRVCSRLIEAIRRAPKESFLLKGVIEAIGKANLHLDPPLTFSWFEYYLNQKAALSEEENYEIRAKISGKLLPRGSYQALFPIGLGNTFKGSHFVAAHFAPDADTTTASFFGWLDAFSAKVADGIHYWNLPEIPESTSITHELRASFGEKLFEILPRVRPTLTLSALDLVTEEGVVIIKQSTRLDEIQTSRSLAHLVVDDEGCFITSWQRGDTEEALKQLLEMEKEIEAFSATTNEALIETFAEERPSKEIFLKKLGKQKPSFAVKELEEMQDAGLQFIEKGRSLEQKELFKTFSRHLKSIKEKAIAAKHKISTLEHFIHLKKQQAPKLLPSSDVEEIRAKMGGHDFLPCLLFERPLGVVWAHTLSLDTLGTVSMRDFGNFEETSMASYLSLISVIDHHKSNFKTPIPPVAIIQDAQSANVLVAEEALSMNGKISSLSLTLKDIEKALQSQPSTELTKRLLERKLAIETRGTSWIHPAREFLEYYFFLLATFDDTDLLSKVTFRDVEIVSELILRLNTLATAKEEALFFFAPLYNEPDFPKEAAAQILQNEEVCAIYQALFSKREKDMEALLKNPSNTSLLFSDTKEQNKCAKIGQIKLFPSNRALFEKEKIALISAWVDEAKKSVRTKEQLDLHLMMISTIPSAQEVFEGKLDERRFEDEMWIWVPATSTAKEHLAFFLNAFSQRVNAFDLKFSVEIPETLEFLEEVFERNFPGTLQKGAESQAVIVRFKAGALNSRKAFVSPALPKIVG